MACDPAVLQTLKIYSRANDVAAAVAMYILNYAYNKTSITVAALNLVAVKQHYSTTAICLKEVKFILRKRLLKMQLPTPIYIYIYVYICI